MTAVEPLGAFLAEGGESRMVSAIVAHAVIITLAHLQQVAVVRHRRHDVGEVVDDILPYHIALFEVRLHAMVAGLLGELVPTLQGLRLNSLPVA